MTTSLDKSRQIDNAGMALKVKDIDASGTITGTFSGPVAGAVVATALTATSVASSGAVTSSSATAGVGYAVGAGGAVTQITDSTTGVTINTPCGKVTTVALTTAAAAEEVFTVTNSAVAVTDVIVVSTTYAGGGTPAVTVKGVAAGSFKIVITNLHASAALDAVVVVNFAVIKSVIT